MIDFDNTAAIGTELGVAIAPYARLLGDEDSKYRNTFGFLNARSEQFAIGSIFYYMTRGFEPYDNEYYGKDHGPVMVDLLQKMQFPKLDDNEVDLIIQSCWLGKCDSIKSLSTAAKLLGGIKASASIKQKQITEQDNKNVGSSWQMASLMPSKSLSRLHKVNST